MTYSDADIIKLRTALEACIPCLQDYMQLMRWPAYLQAHHKCKAAKELAEAALNQVPAPMYLGGGHDYTSKE